MDNIKYRTCNKCGWVHFSVTRTYAEDQIKEFNDYFQTLSKEDQMLFYRGNLASISSYEECFRCGNNYKNFRDSVTSEIPNGSTIQPIIKS